VSELAASLEGAVGVTTIVISAATLTLLTVLVRSMAALDTKVVSELATGFEGAVRVTLEVVSDLKIGMEGTAPTPLSLLLAPPMVSWW
jgi:hypothetical protein